VKLTADFMAAWFGLPVKTRETISLSVIPKSARRIHPQWGDKQILTGYVLEEVLLPVIPDDAIGYLALTASDLWPGEGWNFVFGQASLSERVGVWSIYRKGNADGTKTEFAVVLRRTLQTATHEMGHMMGMLHCKEYMCDMNGSNSLPESDRRPLVMCPECLKKLLWATKADPVERFESLGEFCDEHSLEQERDFFDKSLKVLGGEGRD
jgi:archaemetzincin